MKISFYPKINFGAKNERIRRADDVQRRARDEFPMISPTYIDEFYFTKFEPKTIFYSNCTQNKILSLRCLTHNSLFNKRLPEIERMTLYGVELSGMKNLRAGNCEENAKAAMAALCANGYCNSERVSLYGRVEFLDKKTKEVLYSERERLDHSFVVTDMQKEYNPDAKKDIVVDPWLGFADSESGANSRFKRIYGKKDFKVRDHLKFFTIKQNLDGKKLELNNIIIRTYFEYVPAETKLSEYQVKHLGEYARNMFDKIMLPKKDKT